MTLDTRARCRTFSSSRSMRALSLAATCPGTPRMPTGIRAEKFPRPISLSTASNRRVSTSCSRSCAREVRLSWATGLARLLLAGRAVRLFAGGRIESSQRRCQRQSCYREKHHPRQPHPTERVGQLLVCVPAYAVAGCICPSAHSFEPFVARHMGDEIRGGIAPRHGRAGVDNLLEQLFVVELALAREDLEGPIQEVAVSPRKGRGPRRFPLQLISSHDRLQRPSPLLQPEPLLHQGLELRKQLLKLGRYLVALGLNGLKEVLHLRCNLSVSTNRVNGLKYKRLTQPLLPHLIVASCNSLCNRLLQGKGGGGILDLGRGGRVYGLAFVNSKGNRNAQSPSRTAARRGASAVFVGQLGGGRHADGDAGWQDHDGPHVAGPIARARPGRPRVDSLDRQCARPGGRSQRTAREFQTYAVGLCGRTLPRKAAHILVSR